MSTDPNSYLDPNLEAAPVPMEPVQKHERLDVVDVLRGFALFGILLVNMQFYTTPMPAMNSPEPYWPATHDLWADALIEWFGTGKFYVLFSFLFGLGIAIQVGRAGVRGKSHVGYHVRRMLVLLVIGLVHAYLIWMGDILTLYAIIGLVMTAFLYRQPKTCLIWSLICFGLPAAGLLLICAAMIVAGLVPSLNEGAMNSIDGANFAAAAAEAKRIYATGSVGEIITQRATEVISTFPILLFLMGWVVFALFLLGLYVGKQGYFYSIADHRDFLRKWRLPAFMLGLVANGLGALGLVFLPTEYVLIRMGLYLGGQIIGGIPLSFAYVSTILLWWTDPTPTGQPTLRQSLLAWLAPMGRMALTNYLMQSVLCNLIFYSYGLGLFASVGPAVGLAITVGIFALQVLWSNLWLRHFRFGPMEWLWRSLTYGQLQPMRA